jgi:hypothetical protein
MKGVLILFLVCLLQVSCSSDVTPEPQPAVPIAPAISSTLELVRTATFEVVAWVSDPDPEPGERVMLYGSLLKDGVHLGGMAMRASWPDEDQERGIPNCSVQVIYGSGVCIVETEDFQPGAYVPIMVSFEYQGKIYRGETGFTLRKARK